LVLQVVEAPNKGGDWKWFSREQQEQRDSDAAHDLLHPLATLRAKTTSKRFNDSKPSP
jgi:hypothetical protein